MARLQSETALMSVITEILLLFTWERFVQSDFIVWITLNHQISQSPNCRNRGGVCEYINTYTYSKYIHVQTVCRCILKHLFVSLLFRDINKIRRNTIKHYYSEKQMTKSNIQNFCDIKLTIIIII